MQLRDDKPGFEYPNCWGTFGGQIEEGETPQEALVREIREELDYDVETPELYRVYSFDGYDIYMFSTVNKKITLERFRRAGRTTCRIFFLEKPRQEFPVPLTAEKLLRIISGEEAVK